MRVVCGVWGRGYGEEVCGVDCVGVVMVLSWGWWCCGDGGVGVMVLFWGLGGGDEGVVVVMVLLW